MQDKDQLESDYQNAQNGGGQENYDKITKKRKLQERLTKIKEDLSSLTLTQRNRYDSLMDRKRQMQMDKDEEIQGTMEAHQIELEENRQEYSARMLKDATNFQNL